MIKYIFTIIASVLLLSSTAQAGNLTIGFNDYSMQAAMSQVVSEDYRGRSTLEVSGIYNDREDSKTFSTALEIVSPLGSSGVELGAGVKAYYVTINKLDIAAGGLGVLASFTPPSLSKLNFSGSLFYCPEIFTSLDGDRMISSEIAAKYEIASRAHVYLGYSNTKADLENNQEWTIDRAFRGGLILKF